MTLHLILSRHAKSDWEDPLAQDHDRVLNPRGVKSADAIGHWLCDNGYSPTEVLCSSARRTAQTYEGMLPHFDTPPTLALLPQLYLAGAHIMLHCLQSASSASVMMIGHNPGIAEFAELLLRTPPRDSDFMRYPTGATAIMRFDKTSWRDVGFGDGSLLDFTVPRRLMP